MAQDNVSIFPLLSIMSYIDVRDGHAAGGMERREWIARRAGGAAGARFVKISCPGDAPVIYSATSGKAPGKKCP